MKGRYICISDLHGTYKELEDLLKKTKYDKNTDVLISLGDVNDRGMSPPKCFEILIQNNAIMVQSNHDDRLIRWRKKEKAIAAGQLAKNDMFLKPTHQASLDNIMAHPRADDIWAYMEAAPLYYQFEVMGKKYVCLHGGVLPYAGLHTDPKLMIRLRQITPDTLKPIVYKKDEKETGVFWATLWKGPEYIIFGHSVFEDVQYYDNAVGIDQGCVYGGKLTAFIVHPDGREEIVQVKARKIYYKKDGD